MSLRASSSHVVHHLQAAPEVGALPPAVPRGFGRLGDLASVTAELCGMPAAFVALPAATGEPPVAIGAHGVALDALPPLTAVESAVRAAAGVVRVGGTFGGGALTAVALRTEDDKFLGTLGVISLGSSTVRSPEQLAGLATAGRLVAAQLKLEQRVEEHRQIERPLRQRAAQQAGAAALGQRALRGLDLSALMGDAAELVADELALDFCQIWELLPDDHGLLLTGAVGWRRGDVGHLVLELDPSSQPVFNLATPGAVFVDDVAKESRFKPPAWVAAQGAQSGFSVSIPGPTGPFGVIGGHARTIRAFSDDDASFLQSVANVIGAAIERRRTEEIVRHQATHDPLTGLPNRQLLLERLGDALTVGTGEGGRPALLFLDLDRFKLVNDTLGHDAGDELLIAFGERLRQLLRPQDLLARLGGDEFVVLLEEVDSEDGAAKVAERLGGAFGDPLPAGDHVHFVSVCIGVAVSAPRHRRPEMLLQEADSAMYRAKQRGRGSYEVFDGSMLAAAHRELRLERALRTAVERRELSLVYQPLVSLRTGETVKVEALLRWTHPELGSVPPDVFIRVAEDTGLIHPIGSWVLDEACRQAARWNAARPGLPPLPVNVNVSARQVSRPGLTSLIAAALREHGLPAEQLGLELTESTLLEEVSAPLPILAELKQLGVRLVLDDFGTGYSSLSYLTRFPLDEIKLDRSFVQALGGDNHDLAIVDVVLALGRALNLAVVAEGIESAEQLALLRAHGAECGQGYLFSRPLNPQALESFFSAQTFPLKGEPAQADGPSDGPIDTE